jgi:hypothetical protein
MSPAERRKWVRHPAKASLPNGTAVTTLVVSDGYVWNETGLPGGRVIVAVNEAVDDAGR